LGFSTYYGAFAGLEGTLTLDPKAPEKSAVQITVPLKRIVTADKELDDKLLSDAFFDAAQFPTATFVSKAIAITGPRSAKIEGELTLHGVTKPVTLDAHFVGAGPMPFSGDHVVGFDATATVRRSEFGIKQFVPMVGDDVKLQISAEFDRPAT